MTGRNVRVLLGIFGILAGLGGFVGILLERRSASQRERVLRTLAEDFRKREAPAPSTESAVVWEGRTFRPGDRVRIMKWAGTVKPNESGASVELSAGQGRTGIVVAGEPRQSTSYQRIDPKEPIQIVRVRWFPQQWKAQWGSALVDLPQFESTIHVSYLEHF